MGYKLNKITKTGIALGLVAITLALPTGCTKKYSSYTSGKPTTSQNKTVTSDYIDTLKSNEFRVYDEDLNTINIKLDSYNYMNFLNTLNSSDSTFKYEQYYGLDEALSMYNNQKVNKQTNSNILDETGKIDPTKLIQQIQNNNKKYMDKEKDAINTFYSDMSTSDMTMICKIIAEVINSKFNGIEISKAANTLNELTMFQRTGSPSNAYITNSLTFVFNPNMTGMYADMQKVQGTANSKEEIIKEVITHEVMHLLQYAASDTNEENGLESGICRMYNLPNKDAKVPVDSLWFEWLLEASAELGMSEYMNITPGTYAKKISYARSYNLARFNELDLKKQNIEDIVFNTTLEDAYKNLELYTKNEQQDFLKYLYSVEITQSDPKDFWENYTKISETSPSDSEKLAIRMEIRTEAVKYLSNLFYNNLADSMTEGKITDLDTVFYLVRNWELDVFGHLEYTKSNSIDAAKDFIKWQDQVQTALFTAIAESNGLQATEVTKMYEEYNLQANVNDQIYNNCNLDAYNSYTSEYITSAKNYYSTSNFTRNSLVKKYLENTSKKIEETTITK